MKIDRLMSLLNILLEKKKVTAPALSQLLEVSTRTIYRDIEVLNLAGIPILTEQGIGGGISIMENYKINNNILTTTDLSSLFLALNNLPLSNNKDLTSTKSKLKNLIPPKDLEKIEFKSKQILIDLESWDGNEISKLELNLLKTALDNNNLISFKYLSFNGLSSSRKIEPYRLILKGSFWYLQGYCLNRNDFRTFKIARIKDLKILKTNFTPREFNSDDNKIQSWNDKATVKVKLLIDEDIKSDLINFYGPSVITSDKENKSLATIPFNGTDYEYRYLLGFANKAIILEPIDVKENLITLLKKTLNSYN